MRPIGTLILFLLSTSACDAGGDKAMEYIDEKAEEAVPPTTQLIDAPAARVETRPTSQVKAIEDGVNASPGDLKATVEAEETQSDPRNPDESATPMPVATPSFPSVSTNGSLTCRLDEDGSFLCLGDSTNAHATPPDAAFATISVGGSHSRGITAGGDTLCWGSTTLARPPRLTLASHW